MEKNGIINSFLKMKWKSMQFALAPIKERTILIRYWNIGHGGNSIKQQYNVSSAVL